MSPTAKPSDETGKPYQGLGQPFRVLIADDDHDTVLSLSEIFREEGHQTKGVYRGDEVVAAITEFGADVALIDLMMPGMSGLDVARELRQRYGSATPLLIAVTAWNTSTDKILARASGFDEHVGKPYDPNDLVILVQERITERRSRRNVAPAPLPLGAADTLHSRLLRRLADVLGGTEAVRRALMVPSRDMSRWLAGGEPMPIAIFVKATDLLISSTPTPNGVLGLEQGGVERRGATDDDASG